MIRFNHFNFNVLDLQKSLDFYREALELAPVREKNAADGSFRLVYLGDGESDFTLELTWLRDRKESYDLGELEYHLAFVTTGSTSCTKSTRGWAASALKTPAWASISSTTPTATGSRSCHRDKEREADREVRLPFCRRLRAARRKSSSHSPW